MVGRLYAQGADELERFLQGVRALRMVWMSHMAVLLGTASAAVELNIGGFMRPADQVIDKLDEIGSYSGSGGSGFFDKLTSGALAFGTALIGPMTAGTLGAIELEDAVTGVGASLGTMDPGVLDDLQQMFLDVGSASRYSAVEVANLSDSFAKAGFSADDILGGLAESTVLLSQATGDGLVPATNGMIQVFSIWNEEVVGVENAMTDASKAADIFTVAANQSAGGIQDVIAGLTNAGPALAGVGLSFEESAAAISFFTNYGFSGSEIGTKLSRTLTQLANPTAEAATLLDQLGVSAFDASGAFIGFPALFDQLQAGFAGWSDEAKLAALQTIFGAEAFDLIAIAAETGGDPLRAFEALMGQSGVAAEQSALRMGTVLAKLGELKESFASFLTSLVTGLLPAFHIVLDVANGLVNILSSIPGPIKTIVGALAGLLAGAALITRAVQGWQLLSGILSGFAGETAVAAGTSRGLMGTLLRFIPVFGLLGAGVLAWQSNFLGVRDAMTAFGKGFSQWWKTLGAAGDIDPVSRSLAAIGKGFSFVEKQGGPLAKVAGKLSKGFLSTARVTNAFGEALETVWKNGAVTAGVIAGIPDPLQDTAKSLLVVADGAFDLVRAFQRDGLRGALDALPGEAQQIGRALNDLFGEMLDGASIAAGWVLDVGIPAVTGWVADNASNVWDAITSAANWAWDGLVSLGGWVLDVAVPAVGGWLSATAGNIWGALTTAAGWAWAGLVQLGAWTLSVAAPTVWGWITDAATDTWTYLKAAAGWAWDGLADLGAWTLDVAPPAILILWIAGDEIITALGSVVARLTSWTLNVGLPETYLVGWNIIDAILNKLNATVVTLTDWTMQIDSADVVDLLFDVGGAIADKILENPVQAALAAGAITLLLVGAPVILLGAIGLYVATAFLKAIPDSVLVSAGSLMFSLVGFGVEVIGLISEVTLAVLLRLAEAPIRVGGAIIDLVELGWNVVADVAGGVRDAIFELIPDDLSLPSFDVGVPNIEWPSMDDITSLVPEDLKDFLSNPWKWLMEHFALGADTGQEANVAGTFNLANLPPSSMDVGAIGQLQGIGMLGSAYITLVTQAQNAADALSDVGASADIANFAAANATPSVQGLSDTFSRFDSGAAPVPNRLREFGSAAAQAAPQLLAFRAATEQVIQSLAQVVQGAVQGMNAFRAAITAGVAAAVGALRSGMAQMVATASGYRGTMLSAGVAIGAALGQGIGIGIDSQVGFVASRAAALVTTTINAAKSAAAISSPSRVMRDEVGHMLGLGAAIGVEDMYPRMATAMAGLVMVPEVPHRYTPDVPNRSFATSGGPTIVNNNSPIQVDVTVEGNVTSEEELGDRISIRLMDAITQAKVQRDMALGVR